jgi:signal transduction histidine kinase
MSTPGPRFSNRVRRYAFAIMLGLAAVGTEWLLWPLLGQASLLVALPSVIGAVWFGGTGPGWIPALASLAVVAWRAGFSYLLAPTNTEAATVGLFLLTTLLACAATGQLRRSARGERGRRIDSERLLVRKALLEAVATAVSAASTSLETAGACVSELTHATGAAFGAVALVVGDGDRLQVVQAVGEDENAGRCVLSPNGALAAAVRQREVMVAPDAGARDSAFVVDPFLTPYQAFIIVPLLAAGRAIGAVSLAFDAPRECSGDERECLLGAGCRAGAAIHRARLYDAAERARAEGDAFRVRADAELQERRRAEEAHRESEARYRTLAARTHRLYSLSAALSEAITLDAVARTVVRQGRSVVGAAAGSVAFVDGDAFETLYAEDYPPAMVEAWCRFSAEQGLCTTAAAATRSPVLVGSFDEWQALYPRSAATAADGGFTSVAALPLLVDNAPIGVLSFHFTVPVNFDQEYRALLTSVAHHASQAIDRARLYDAAQRGRVDAEAANSAKDDFLSIVSHELRTPLNAILGWGAMLRDGSLDPARMARATNAIVNNATRQAHLIDDLLEVSRIAAGRVSLDLQELELAEIVRGAVEAMLPVAEQRGLDLQVEALPLARVVGDPNRLEQVFGNLLANAVKFTAPGGRVTIGGAVENGTVRMRIADTGCGIDADALPHIFERFRQGNNTTARSVGGLGLGLFIARRLVEALQGRLIAESAGRGAGAAFTVMLPVATMAAVDLPASPRLSAAEETLPAVAPDLSDLHVLLVDDEPDAREMASATLDLAGALVTTAASMREALEKLEHDDIDLVLADLAMPEEDGYELIRRIRSHADPAVARLPAAAVTACAREDERQRALAAGFDLHVAKPLVPAALLEMVARLASGATANA